MGKADWEQRSQVAVSRLALAQNRGQGPWDGAGAACWAVVRQRGLVLPTRALPWLRRTAVDLLWVSLSWVLTLNP